MVLLLIYQHGQKWRLSMNEKQEHDWKFKGCIPHNGEYWYKCSKCGCEDWIASYGTRDQLMPKECIKDENRRM